jgi:phycocyanobilin lyase subunit alpha
MGCKPRPRRAAFSSLDHEVHHQENRQLTVAQAIANLQGDDLGLRVYAAWWLGRFRIDAPEAIAGLISALDDTDDRTDAGGYPLRRNAARALGKLGHRRAIPALLLALECSDFYVREAAAQALESLGDPSCSLRLLELLTDQIPGTLPAPEPPHLAQPFEAIIEALGTLGVEDARPLIAPFLEHAVPRIQYAALRAMFQLTPDPAAAGRYGEQLVNALSDENLQLRRVVLSDLGAIGYLPAAAAIARTPAENSLKLIALRGVLEKQVSATLPDLSAEAIKVMMLMDGLL